MERYFLRSLLLFLPVVLVSFQTFAQDVKITLGPDEIAENQSWTITITVHNERLRSYDNFPEIDGFRRRGTATQSTTSMINGQVSSSNSVIMSYSPVRQGVVTVSSFSMKVNDKTVHVAGKKVKIIGAAQQQRDPAKSIFERDKTLDDFFGSGEPEFVELKDDAFFALTTSKNEVYVGEGFNTTLSFYVAEDNRAPLQFYELSRQLSDILRKIKPANCWEENFNIENIEAERVTINGKDYSQYKIYQATYFPLNSEDVTFPSVSLEMIKYKVAKNPSFFGQNRKEDFKAFQSKPKTVKVKDLPPHPLKDIVAVGDYKLDERMRSTDLQTGQSASYEFNIFGEGNISAISKPRLLNDGTFEFYDPNERIDISRANNRVTGTKSFNYYMIPKEPGKYKLGKYLKFVFFNPNEKKYDTLSSRLTLYVTGESKINEVIASNDPGSFYDKIQEADNTLKASQSNNWQKWALNGFLFVIVGASLFFLIKK